MQSVTSIFSVQAEKSQPLYASKWHNVIIHTIAVALVAVIHYLENNPVITFYVGGAICILAYGYMAFSEAKKSFLRINPLSFYMAWYVVGLGASAIYAGTVVSSGNSLGFVVKLIEPQDLAIGYVIYLIGSLALHIGIELSSPARNNVIIDQRSEITYFHLAMLVALWAVGMFAALFPDNVQWMGSFAATLQKLTPAAVVFIALNPPQRLPVSRYSYYLLIIAGTGGAFVSSLMANSKASIMFSLFPLMWMFIIRRHLWKYFVVLMIALTIFYFGIVAPVVMTARNLEMKEGETYAGRILRVYQSLDVESYSSAQQYQENGLELFLYRQFDAPAIGFLVDDVRAYGYRQGETMERIAYSFIPRILWPEKPTVTVGGWFYMYAGGQKEEGETDTSFGITATGECYWNFGMPGVVIGMLIIGLTIGGLWRLSGTDPRVTLSRIFLFYSVVLNICNMADWVTVITLNVILFLVSYPMIRIQDSHEAGLPMEAR